jgi:TatD DNase family protein
MKQYAFFDIHSHLHDKVFQDDREKLLEEMKGYGVATITVGTDLHESKQAVALVQAHDNVYATIGLHPADNVKEVFDKEAFTTLLLENKKIVAIGECGLDYHYIEHFFERDQKENGITHTKDAEADRQQGIFEEQVIFACEHNLPLMLHGRPSKGSMDAYEDMLFILEKAKKEYGTKLRGNAHFFVGNIEIAKRFVDIGFTMSFSGVITFTKDYDDVVRYLPITMILAETDSPYATPAPFRGQRNSPMYVQEVVAKIAVLRNEPFEEVRMQLLENTKRLFDLTF